MTQSQGDMMGTTIYGTKPMIGARSFEVKETVVAGPSPTGQMRVRRNINSLSDPQFDILMRAFKRLNNANSTFYLDFVNTHNAVWQQVHFLPQFLPWHRAFLLRFEDMLIQEADDPTFGVPYWNWCEDVTRRRDAPMWGPTRFGGWGDPVSTGPFSGTQWPTISPDGTFTGRNLIRTNITDPRLVTTNERVLTNLRLATFGAFSQDLEAAIHGNMHIWVGGTQGQMGFIPNSVNDPVFWLHHCNIDRIWAQWQSLFPEQLTEDRGMTESTLLPETFIRDGYPKGRVTVASVLDAPNNRYVYEGQGGQYQTDVIWGPDGNFQSDAANFSSTGTPSLAVHNRKLYCLRQESRNQGWVRGSTFDGTAWDGSDGHIAGSNNPFGISDAPALAVYQSQLHLANEGRGNDGWLWHATRGVTIWSGHARLPSDDKAYGTSGAPALAVYGGKLHCVRQGRSNSGWLWHSVFDGTSWSTDELIYDSNGSKVGISGSPALAVYNGVLHCVRQGRGNQGRLWWTAYNGTSWSPDKLIPNNGSAYTVNASPALVVFAGKLICVHDTATLHYKSDEGTLYVTDDGYLNWGGSVQGGPYYTADGYLNFAAYDGTSWGTSGRITNGTNSQFGTSGGPGLAIYGGKLFCIREDRGNVGRMRMCTAAFGTPTVSPNTTVMNNVTKPMIRTSGYTPPGKTGSVST